MVVETIGLNYETDKNAEINASAKALRDLNNQIVIEQTVSNVNTTISADTYVTTAEDFETINNNTEKTADKLIENLYQLRGQELRDALVSLNVTRDLIETTIGNLETIINERNAEQKVLSRKIYSARNGDLGAGGTEKAEMLQRVQYKLEKENQETSKKIAKLKEIIEELDRPVASEMTGISTIENKSPEVIAWEKKHQMEIVEDKEYEDIAVLHKNEVVSAIVSLGDLKGTPSISISGENLVFTYADSEKPDNIILYYPKNGKLMEKTETSGTSALFEITPPVSMVSNN